ncbi:DNA polymerase III subunit beta [Candidatus Marinimicrobia bacterium]|nr:DNA polymerase III subunit beta [Candidatus Neomarinimicrobiota bacterium]
MKFSINKDILQNLLLEHQKVVPLRTTLPILSCVFFKVQNQRLIIKTTDLEQTIISSTSVKDEKEGLVCVPMNKLSEIVSALPSEEIRVTINEDFLVEINSNQGTYKITGKDSEEFPDNAPPQTKETIEMPGKDFAEIINKTIFATSKDDLKPALSGVYINIDKEKTTAVATDGHRLVKYEKKIKSDKKHSIVVPVKFLKIIKNTIDEKNIIKIEIDDNILSTNQKNFTITTRIIKETFPDFNSVIPDNNTIQAEVDKKELVSCLKRVSIFSNRTTRQTVLSFSEKGVVVSAQDPETSTSGKEHADCSYKGEALTVSYNAKYLIEVLQHIDTSAAIIYLSTPLSAAIVGPTKQKDNEKITTLLMPLRLNN